MDWEECLCYKRRELRMRAADHGAEEGEAIKVVLEDAFL